jgi:VIT1/CCC1 family predicted Fe2+/Mn2+ transporter
VSNTALVMGFAGSGVSTGTVLFAGFAGLLAGAFSMAAGEYVSVASQRDLYKREIALEARELRENPQEEQRELELLYRAKGLDAATAKRAAQRIMADPETALDTLAREELGLDPDDLGDPGKVAASSFAAFAVGAIVPVVPYLFLGASAALALAIALAVLAMVLVGGAVGRMSGLGVVRSAVRQLAVGGGAAAVTYVIGRLVGAGLG